MASITKNWSSGTGSVTVTYTGSGDGTITVQSDPNDLSVARSMTLTVTNYDNSISREVTVSQAAQVQPTPSGYYYIYRTSSNIIERRDIAQYPTVNFPAIAGNSYGGVFTDYGGKGTVATELANGDPVTFVDDMVQDDGSVYAGELTAAGSTLLFDSNNAITTGTTAYTPTVGTMYFIREIPDWALRNYRHLTYTGSGSNRHVTNVWLLSGTDSLSYSSFSRKFKEETQSEFEQTSYSTARTVTVPRASGSGTQSLNCGTVFKTKGCPTGTGFMAADTTSILSKLEVGKNYIFYYEVVTPDGIVVHSPVKFKLVVTSLTLKGITVEEIPWE